MWNGVFVALSFMKSMVGLWKHNIFFHFFRLCWNVKAILDVVGAILCQTWFYNNTFAHPLGWVFPLGCDNKLYFPMSHFCFSYKPEIPMQGLREVLLPGNKLQSQYLFGNISPIIGHYFLLIFREAVKKATRGGGRRSKWLGKGTKV